MLIPRFGDGVAGQDIVVECPRSWRESRASPTDKADGRVRRWSLQVVNGDRRPGVLRCGSGQQCDAEPGSDQFTDAGGAVGLKVDAWNETLDGGCVGEDRVQPAAGGETDERLVTDGGKCVHSSGGPPVARRSHQDQRFLDQGKGDVAAG